MKFIIMSSIKKKRKEKRIRVAFELGREVLLLYDGQFKSKNQIHTHVKPLNKHKQSIIKDGKKRRASCLIGEAQKDHSVER